MSNGNPQFAAVRDGAVGARRYTLVSHQGRERNDSYQGAGEETRARRRVRRTESARLADEFDAGAKTDVVELFLLLYKPGV